MVCVFQVTYCQIRAIQTPYYSHPEKCDNQESVIYVFYDIHCVLGTIVEKNKMVVIFQKPSRVHEGVAEFKHDEHCVIKMPDLVVSVYTIWKNPHNGV